MAILEGAAQSNFDRLSRAEIKLLRAAAEGKPSICGLVMDDDAHSNDPEQAHEWEQDREVRAGLIRWLCVDRDACQLVDASGLRVYGARIQGCLNLSGIRVPFALAFRRCWFMNHASFWGMELPQLDLTGSRVHSINADGTQVNGSVLLRDRFHAEGEVRFLGAQIGGCLDCRKGKFSPLALLDESEHAAAFRADGMKVGGSVFLDEGFHAKGMVRLAGAYIGGDLVCSSGSFQATNENVGCSQPNALDADGIDVKGSVALNGTFSAEGEVRLIRARIGRDLDCRGAILTRSNQTEKESINVALRMDGMHLGGSAFLSDGFRSQSDVRLVGARIDGDLLCKNAAIPGLIAQSAVVGGRFWWADIAHPNSAILNLDHARVGVLADDKDSWPGLGNLRVDGFAYDRIISWKDFGSRVNWLARQRPFAAQPYRQLAKVLAAEGDDSGARRVLFEMEHRRRERQDTPLAGKIWNGILNRTVGYGYYPGRALFLILVLSVVGFLLFWAAYSAGNIAPTDRDAYMMFQNNRELPPHYERFHAFIYSMENTFPLVSFGQGARWQPDPNLDDDYYSSKSTVLGILAVALSLSFLFWFRWIQICLGWFLTTLGIAGVTGLIRTSK